ncbi:MAG: YvcK family protein [Clostridiaceae bacterium]|nr:YvcK family protein [Clostridiaceae bacterium]
MKGFFKWFRNEAKMKRWIFIIVIGILLACYGMAKLLIEKQLGINDLVKIIFSFIIGFALVIIGNIFMQRRTLELLVQETDTRDEAKEGQVKSLIFNKKVYDEGPNIVVIGGGTGLDSVLKGLKKYTNNITAIVTVSDYGQQATDSRKILETLPLEDIRNSFSALSEDETVMGGLLNYKFTDGKLKSLCFGDIYLLAMKELYGDFTVSIEQTKKVLNITGKVLPVTLDEIEICAELEDGTVIKNKNKIPEIVTDKVSRINRIFINPSNCSPAPGVIDAIEKADAIIIGPGSLYTNVIPNLLVKGVAKAVKENKGFKIYISNIMTEPGQTDNYSLSEHIKAIHEHAGKGIVDYCIYDTGEIVPEFIRKYNREGADLVEQDINKSKEEGIKMIQRNLSYIDGEFIRHNPDAIASSIIELICEDLKFRDMQNDTQYLMLNSRLKKTKKQLKTTMDKKKDNKNIKVKNDRKVKSKFAKKYQDRIVSIKESDEKAQKRKQAKTKLEQNKQEEAPKKRGRKPKKIIEE